MESAQQVRAPDRRENGSRLPVTLVLDQEAGIYGYNAIKRYV
jgi:hypothetical protein